MKIFSIRNLLGVAAVYGAAQYAKKHGGARNALEGLITKVREAANMKKEELIGKAHDASVGSQPSERVEPVEFAESAEPSSVETGSYSSGYSTDFGSSGTNRRS